VISPIATHYHSVCLSVHCAQTAEDIDVISFAYHSPMSLPDGVKIWLTPVNFFLPKFRPKVSYPPRWLERWRHSTANCGRMVRDNALVTMESLQEQPSIFRMVPSLTLYDLPFTQKWMLWH